AKSFGFDPSAEEGERQAAARQWLEWGSGRDAVIVGELPETSMIALFNGRDLNGWTVFENGAVVQAQKSWKAEAGALISVGQGFGDIRTNTAFENYVLTMKYKIDGAFGDGGIGVMLTKENEERAIGLRRDAGSYLEVQLLPKRTGDLYLINGFQAKSGGRAIQFSSRRTAEADDQSGKWHELKLTVRDGSAEIELNGTVVNRATDGSKGPGKIVLRNEGARIMYKDILVLPVTP
ncbi:MAG: 3-keto-disaccharide hydrolase, partial [Verrucomicrobiales bacterium]